MGGITGALKLQATRERFLSILLASCSIDIVLVDFRCASVASVFTATISISAAFTSLNWSSSRCAGPIRRRPG